MELSYTLAELPGVAARLLETYGAGRVYALRGELGAGKTTLVSDMCRQLGVDEPVSSPTFSIVNTYQGAKERISHLDCYRLADVEEAIAAGLEELLETATGTVFVEWPEVIEPLLPDDVVFLHLSHDPQGEGRRHLTASVG